MVPATSSSTSRTHRFVPTSSEGESEEKSLPEKDVLQELEEEGLRLAAINMNGVVLSVGCFVSHRLNLCTPNSRTIPLIDLALNMDSKLFTQLPLLSSTSASPLIHHLSSVAALVPAPTRMLYSATKTAGLAAFKTCAVECERNGGTGSGVRFLGQSQLPERVRSGLSSIV